MTNEVEVIGKAAGAVVGTYVAGPVGGMVGSFVGGFLDDLLGGIGDVLSSIGDFIFGKSLVEEIQEEMGKQIKVLAESVATPIHQMGERVEGGMWQGDGASRYLEESRLLLADTEKIVHALKETKGSIGASMTSIIAADEKCVAEANGFADMAARIY